MHISKAIHIAVVIIITIKCLPIDSVFIYLFNISLQKRLIKHLQSTFWFLVNYKELQHEHWENVSKKSCNYLFSYDFFLFVAKYCAVPVFNMHTLL